MEKVKYRVIKSADDYLVILEDGGIAEVHYADEMTEGDGRQSTTEYYHKSFDQKMLDSGEDLWEQLNEHDMSYNNWTTPFDDPAHLKDALNFLSVLSDFVLDESIWPDFEDKVGITPSVAIESTLSDEGGTALDSSVKPSQGN